MPKLTKQRSRTRVAALDLEKVEELASKGLTLEQIAHATGMNVRTLYTKRKWHEEVRNAIDRGAARGIEVIANELFTAAKNGNTTAQIFYLKSRAGWRDRPLVEINQGGGEKLTIVNLLRRLDPLPDGLSEGCRRAYGELEPLKQPAIEDLTSANPDPDMPPPAKADEGDVTDRRLAAIHFANRHKHQP